jgi:flagellar biogenesis protein FliO
VTVLLAAVAVVLALRNRKGGTTRSLKVTARAGLSRNVAIVVVEVEGRRLLIGAAANSVNLLAELGPTSAPDGEDDVSPAPQDAPRGAIRPASAGGTVIDRLRSMTTRSFATDGPTRDPRGLL